MADQVVTVNTTVGDVPVTTTSTIPDTSFDTLIIDHTVNIGAQGSPDLNVAIAVDTSGSAGWSSRSDVDGDGIADSFLEAQVYAAKELFKTYIENGYDPSTVTVTLVEYGSNASLVGVYTLEELVQFEADIDALTPGGATNFAAPLSKIHDSWTAQGVSDQASNSIVFMSDGRQNRGGDFTDEAQALEDDFGALISGVGVGSGSSLTAGRNGGLNDLDNTGGAIGKDSGAVQVLDASQLTAEVGAPPPVLDVDAVTVTVTYPDPANSGETITIAETIPVGDPRLVPTPSGYALRNFEIDYAPNPAGGTTINVEMETWFNDGSCVLSTGAVPIQQMICFVGETRILTSQGEKRADESRIGDLVLTKDHGMQPIRWIGRCLLDAGFLAAQPKARPVHIAAGALGRGKPWCDFRVSQQHRILIQSSAVEPMIGTKETVIAAKKLCGLKGVAIDNGCAPLEYIHFLFDRHELVLAEGAWTESLYIGPQVWAYLDQDTKQEFRLILGTGSELDVPRQTPARQIPPPRLQRDIAWALRDCAEIGG